MRALAALSSIGLAACGPSTRPAADVASSPPARPAAPDCPPVDNVVERARAAWALGPGEPIEITACTPGHFGEDGWLVEAFVRVERDGGTAHEQWHSILGSAAFDRVIVRGTATEVPPWYVDMGGSTWTAADLDGDGVDELLGVSTYDHHGYIVESLAAFRVAAGVLEPLGTLALSYENAGAAEDEASLIDCTATHIVETAGATKQLVVTGTHAIGGAAAAAEDQCPKLGVHRYGLVDGALAER